MSSELELINTDSILADIDVQSIAESGSSACEGRTANID
jgi:hypothetical protein